MRTKTSDIYYLNNDYTNVIKVYEDYIELETKEVNNTKSAERQNN